MHGQLDFKRHRRVNEGAAHTGCLRPLRARSRWFSRCHLAVSLLDTILSCQQVFGVLSQVDLRSSSQVKGTASGAVMHWQSKQVEDRKNMEQTVTAERLWLQSLSAVTGAQKRAVTKVFQWADFFPGLFISHDRTGTGARPKAFPFSHSLSKCVCVPFDTASAFF